MSHFSLLSQPKIVLVSLKHVGDSQVISVQGTISFYEGVYFDTDVKFLCRPHQC